MLQAYTTTISGLCQVKMQRKSMLSMLKFWIVLCMLLNALQHSKVAQAEDIANVTPCELETIINQLVNPNPEYQMHAAALRNQLKNILTDRQLAVGEEQYVGDYQTPVDKRTVAALAAQGLLRGNPYKRGLATLAKNGQLPTQDPETADNSLSRNDKRYLGSVARDRHQQLYGKRNVGTLARDYQLPTGKRNLATLARLGLLSSQPKRNLASIARYNSMHMSGANGEENNDLEAIEGTATDMNEERQQEKRNIGALKASPVHGIQQKRRDSEEVYLPVSAVAEPDYIDYAPNSYWWYPNYAGYADLDWGYRRAQKRFLDTSKDPELFGMENAWPIEEFAALARAYPTNDNINNEAIMWEPTNDEMRDSESERENETDGPAGTQLLASPQKRHIGAVYRSGYLPSYRALRSTVGSMGGAGHFSRSGRARQFGEYYPQLELLRQPTAAVCKRCFLPYRPVVNWGAAGIRGPFPRYANIPDDSLTSIETNALPSTRQHVPATGSWGTPPRIAALHRSRNFRRSEHSNIY